MRSVSLLFLLLSLLAASVSAEFLTRSSTLRTPKKNDRKIVGVVAQSGGSDQSGHIDTIYTPQQTWKLLNEGGVELGSLTSVSLLFRALAAGIFVGFGGILATSVGFDMGPSPPWMTGQGLSRFLSGAVGFPLAILMVAMSGQGTWTGDAISILLSYVKQNTSLQNLTRVLLVTYLGCFLGTSVMSTLATAAALPMIGPCIELAEHKLSMSMMQTFARGVGGGALICMAIFMARANRTMSGKVLSIWFPISTYVICDFEHCLATMFFLVTAKLNGADFDLVDFLKTILPGTLGNLVGGALSVGVGLSHIPVHTIKGK